MIQPALGVPRIDGTKTTGTRADRTEHHDRGRAGIPALADIRAHRFLTNGAQAMLMDDVTSA